MTHFSNGITTQGPLLTVLIGVSQPRLLAIKAAGHLAPNTILASMLIDTGASLSCVCSSIVRSLGLTPTGTIDVYTPSTGQNAVSVGTYDIGMIISGLTPQDVHTIPSLSVTENDFTGQGIHGLLGRDVLSRAHMFYNGRENVYFLAF